MHPLPVLTSQRCVFVCLTFSPRWVLYARAIAGCPHLLLLVPALPAPPPPHTHTRVFERQGCVVAACLWVRAVGMPVLCVQALSQTGARVSESSPLEVAAAKLRAAVALAYATLLERHLALLYPPASQLPEYQEKFKSVSFHLRENVRLPVSVVTGVLRPFALVRMSAEELTSEKAKLERLRLLRAAAASARLEAPNVTIKNVVDDAGTSGAAGAAGPSGPKPAGQRSGTHSTASGAKSAVPPPLPKSGASAPGVSAVPPSLPKSLGAMAAALAPISTLLSPSGWGTGPGSGPSPKQSHTEAGTGSAPPPSVPPAKPKSPAALEPFKRVKAPREADFSIST